MPVQVTHRVEADAHDGGNNDPVDITGITVNSGEGLIVMGVIRHTTRTVSSITWDQGGVGEGLTLQGTPGDQGAIRSESWAIHNPTPGASKTVRIDLSGAPAGSVWWVIAVDQADLDSLAELIGSTDGAGLGTSAFDESLATTRPGGRAFAVVGSGDPATRVDWDTATEVNDVSHFNGQRAALAYEDTDGSSLAVGGDVVDATSIAISALAINSGQLSAPTLTEHAGTDEDEVWLQATNLDSEADGITIQSAPDVSGSPGTWETRIAGISPADPYTNEDAFQNASFSPSPGDIIWYRARVTDSGGTYDDSDWSTAISVQTPYNPPTSITVGNPTGAGPYQVPISFNGENASATHEVWRAPDSGGSPGSWTLIGEAPAGDDFDDTNAPADNMWYRARASAPGDSTSSFTAAVQASVVQAKFALINYNLQSQLVSGGLVA